MTLTVGVKLGPYETGVSPATVKRQWMVARAWLLRDLKGEAAL